MSTAVIVKLRREIAAAAQEEYDAWTQDEDGMDEEVGSGGICDAIADRICWILNANGVDAWIQSASTEQHTYCLALCREGIVEIDVPHSAYERGEAYTWKKIPNVAFTAEDVTVAVIDPKPENAHMYRDEWAEAPGV
jgi:hypothetical protein